MARSFSFVSFLAYALLMLTFLHDKSETNIYYYTMLFVIAQMLY